MGLGSDIAAGYSLNILNQAVEAIGLSKLYWRYIDKNSRPLEFAEVFFHGYKSCRGLISER